MMLRDIASMAAAAAMLTGMATVPQSASAAPKPTVLEPNTAWNVNWNENFCTLQRVFGTGDQLLLLRMNSYEPGYRFEFFVTGPQMAGFVAGDDITLQIGAHAPLELPSVQSAKTGSLGPGIIFSTDIRSGQQKNPEGRNTDAAEESGKPPIVSDPPFDATLDGVTLARHGQQIKLETHAMAGALKALRSCVDGMMSNWGLDPAVQSHLMRTAKPANRRDMVRRIQAYYPLTQAMQGQQGRLSVIALVDVTGKPTSCNVQIAYSDPAFSKQPCEIIMETQFEPALDAQGKPVPSYYQTTINYSMS